MVDLTSAKSFAMTKKDTPGPIIQPAKYKRGDRVRLIELEQGWDGHPASPPVPQEEGVVLSVDWHNWKPVGGYMYVVEVDEKYCQESFDDGLRELPEDQIAEKLA